MFGFIRRSVKRNFGIDKEYYRFIDDMFGFIPNNIELYKVALIHKSASQSIGGHHINNERLEYLGDAVIESITSDYLFIAYPDRDEGFLTQMRSKIVSRQSLNEMAVFIGLDKYLICKSGVTLQQKHIYGDAFEAMIGAIYLDKGYEFTNRLLINDIFERFLSMDELSDSENDFKSRLIEWCQKNRHTLEFKTQKEIDKKSSNPIFYTTVLIDGIEMGHGTGDSKKSSEQKASCSVSHEMSDEECAKILDKFDRMMSQTPSKPSVKPNTEPKQTKKQSVAESAAEQHSEEATSDSSEHKPEENRRRGRKRKPTNAAETEQAPAAEVSEAGEETQSDAPKRRGRKKRNEQPAAAEQSGTETAAESHNESDEQPAKRRRGRRRKSETAPAGTSAATESADMPADEHTAENSGAEQPAKRRRGRRKKSENAAAEGTATEGAAAEE